MEVSVLNIQGQETGRKVSLNDAVYGITPNDHAIYLDVKLLLANQRQGTAKSKERSEVSGSTRKLGRQKGGGGARRGDINSPVLVGGGRVFGPQENAIMVVEDFTFEAPKTKSMVEVLNNLKVAGKKVLFVMPCNNKFVNLSARNIERINVIPAAALNTYKVLNADVLVMAEGALSVVDGNLNK